jgi:hypothetical protein
LNVRFGPKADICAAKSNVRFTPVTLVSAFCGIPGAASLILGCSGSLSTSNKIIQKKLAFSRRQSGTVSSSGRRLRFGILPRRASSLRWGFGD